MPYIAENPERFINSSIGTGQCAVFVEAAANAPITAHWAQGEKVKGNLKLKKGTAIATFQKGVYMNDTHHGLSHAAIYLDQDVHGISVLDQWIHAGKRQPVHERVIRFKNGMGTPNNDGDAFSVIEYKK